MQILSNLFLKEYSYNHIYLKEGLEDDYDTYTKLKQWFNGKQIDNRKMVLYSPGCGSDFITMFAIYDAIVSSRNKESTFVALDFRNFFDGMVLQTKKMFPKARIWVKESVQPGVNLAEIKFKDKTLRIIYYVMDFTTYFPNILNNNIDIYYERAFELFRTRDTLTMYKVYKNMKPGSLMISDFGFDFASQKKDFKQLKKIPKDFGLYQKFQIWQKTV